MMHLAFAAVETRHMAKSLARQRVHHDRRVKRYLADMETSDV